MSTQEKLQLQIEASQDYDRLARIWNELWGGSPRTAESMRHAVERYPANRLQQYSLLRLGEQVIGALLLGEPLGSYVPGKYLMLALIYPQWRGQGYGRQVYEMALAQLQQREPAPRSLLSFTKEDRPAARHLLESLGFQQVMRYPYSRLDLTAFDSAPFAAVQRRVAAQGIRIASIESLKASDPAWLEKWWDVFCAALMDVPATDPIQLPPLEYFRDSIISAPNLPHDCYFVALGQDGRYLGLSGLMSTADPAYMDTHLTGTRRENRRQGIALALKVAAIEHAKAQGVRQIMTDNEENNPMFGINLKLGFQPVPAQLEYRKELA